jgi:hypothetical protein
MSTVLPGKYIERTFFRVERVDGANVETVKSTINHSRGDTFLLRLECFCGESGLDQGCGLFKIVVPVNFDGVHLL